MTRAQREDLIHVLISGLVPPLASRSVFKVVSCQHGYRRLGHNLAYMVFTKW